MKNLKIFKNEVSENNLIEKIMVTEDTSNLDALGNWLESSNIDFEMIETDEDGNKYAKTSDGRIIIEGDKQEIG